MARPLNRLGIRFGIYMALTVLLSISVVTGGLEWQKHKEQQAFHQSLPTAVKQELQQLRDSGKDHSQRLDEIYDQYWPAQGPGLSVEVISGLALSLLLGLAAAVLSARIFLPLVLLTGWQQRRQEARVQ